MKKVLIKLFCLIILISFVYPICSHAETVFNVLFKENLECDMNDTVEVPIFIHAIDIEGSGILAFECTINYDTDVFEMVLVEDDYFQLDSTLEEDGVGYRYNNETKMLTVYLSPAYIDHVNSSVSEYTEIGKIKLKANDNIPTGDYIIGLDGITIGNDSITGTFTKIHVNGIDDSNGEADNTIERESSLIIKRFGDEREVILTINVNQDGTLIVITPDEENGAEIGYLEIDGRKIEKQNGKFAFASEPNKEYEIYVFGPDGQYLTKKIVTTYIDETSNGDEEPEEKKDDNETAPTEKKKIKTGDVVTMAFITLAIGIVIVMYVYKKKKEQVIKISKH